jgi:triacylglycerol lipase
VTGLPPASLPEPSPSDPPTSVPAASASLFARLRTAALNGVGWALDYIYALRWQVQGNLGHVTPADYELPDAAEQPVLLIPGVYETWQFMRPVADRLHAAGHPVHVVTALRRNTATVPASAELVGDYLKLHDLRSVIIVAHSKGGLIGKQAMLHDEDQRIERMIAISSPFSGSAYARYLFSPALRIFSPTDATLRMLGEQLEINSRITSIWSTFDPHIPGGSQLVGAKNIRLPGVGHFRILGSRRLLETLDEALEAQP